MAIRAETMSVIIEAETKVREFMTGVAGVPYRIHLCSRPNDLVLGFLKQMGPVDELEMTDLVDFPGLARSCVELLPSDLFAREVSEISEIARRFREAKVSVALYDMDLPVEPDKINLFLSTYMGDHQ